MKVVRAFLLCAVLTVLTLVVYLFLLPGPIDAVAYAAPGQMPLTGVLAANELLEAGEICLEPLNGPEDVAIDGQGYLYGGTQDGRIMRGRPGEAPTVFARTGGRPLGLHFDHHGRLIVCDAWKGLLSLSPAGVVTTLCTEADGLPFGFTNDLDISRDGTIYFSDASSRFHQPDYMLDALEARPWGRLLKFEPDTAQVTVLLDCLYFANGVALSRDESFLVVNETWRYRMIRYWLRGPEQGQHEVFVDQLPGFPDGVAADRQGTFWLAVPTLRNERLDALHAKPKRKNVLAKLPKWIGPAPQRYGLVVAIDETGQVRRSMHDIDGTVFSEITSAQPHGPWLYLGTLHGQKIGRVRIH